MSSPALTEATFQTAGAPRVAVQFCLVSTPPLPLSLRYSAEKGRAREEVNLSLGASPPVEEDFFPIRLSVKRDEQLHSGR